MPEIEVSLPDQTLQELDRLLEEGQFVNQEQAIEELLSMGVTAYQPVDDNPTNQSEIEDPMVDQMLNEQQDPAGRGEQGRTDSSF